MLARLNINLIIDIGGVAHRRLVYIDYTSNPQWNSVLAISTPTLSAISPRVGGTTVESDHLTVTIDEADDESE